MVDECSGQCSGCAFKAGAAANREPENQIKGFITAMAGNPFYCHDSLNWKVDIDQAKIVRNKPEVMRAALLAITIPGRTPKVCGGWKAAVKELASRGWFRGEDGSARRLISRHALAALVQAEMNPGSGKRTVSRRNRAMKGLGSCMAILAEDLKKLRVDPEKLGWG